MAEKEKRTPADAEKVERWDRTIRNGDRTVELQYLRDEIMKEVNIDGSTDNPSDREELRRTAERALECALIYINSYVTLDEYDNLLNPVITLIGAMYTDSGCIESPWDCIFVELITTMEEYDDYPRREKSDPENYAVWDFKGSSEERFSRIAAVGAMLQHTEKKTVNRAVKILNDSLAGFAGEEGEKWIEEQAAKAKVSPLKRKFSSPVEIKKELDRYIIGQEHAKRTVSMALFHHISSINSDRERTPQNIILLGDTGSGKTMIAEKAAQVSGLPYVLVDASTLTASGWKGGDIEEVFARLYAKGNLAEYGIVIFDEVDKLVNMGFSADGKNVGRERQSIFLKIMEGVPITDSDGRDKAKEYKTKNMMFIFTGRFAAIDEKRNAENRPFGFGEKVTGKKDGSIAERDAVLRRELRDAGVIEELIGRLAYIEELEVMSEEQMYTAVMMSPDSELNKAKEYVPSIYKKKLTVDCGYIQNIVAEMKKTSLGVRGCNNYLRSRIMELLFDSYEKGDETITLTQKEDAPDCGIPVRVEKEEV